MARPGKICPATALSIAVCWLTLWAVECGAQTNSTTMSIGLGKCPLADKTVVQNFRVDNFMGLWYEVSRTLPLLEVGGRCPRVQYTLNKDKGEIAATYSLVSLTGHERRLSAKAVPANPNATPPTGLYYATVDTINIYFLFSLPVTVPYLVLDTDYDNFAIVYACFSVRDLFYGGGVVILSRTPTITPEIQQKVDSVIKSEGLSALTFTKTDQSCTKNHSED